MSTSRSPGGYAQAYDTLRSAQKPARGAPAYSRWVNRPLGRALAAAAFRVGLTPNQVTALSGAVTYSAIACLALLPPSVALSLLVAAMLLLGYALDSADGQLARLTRSGAPSGEWLDHVVDMGKLCLLHGAVAVSWIRWGVPGLQMGTWALAVPLAFLAVSVVSFFAWLLSDLLIRILRASGKAPAPSGPVHASALRSWLRLPSDYGLLALSFLWFAWIAFPLTYVALLVVNAVILAAALPTWFHQVRTAQEGAS